MHIAKALIAFDAKVNSVNNSYETPCDIVLAEHFDSALRDLLDPLGAMTYEEIENADDDGNGRVSPFTEVDLESRWEKDTSPSRPPSLGATSSGHRQGYRDHHELDLGSDGSPSPPRRAQGGLTSLAEG